MIKNCRWFGFRCFPVLFVLFSVYQDFRAEAATTNQAAMAIDSTEEEAETPNDSANEDVTMTPIRMDQETSSYESTTITVSCGGNITSNEGIINISDCPNDYYWGFRFEECVWIITVQEGHPVVLTFTHFKLEEYTDCRDHYVKVLDGHESSSPILGKFCAGNTPHTTVSSGNKMRVEFKPGVFSFDEEFIATFNRGNAATANETIMASVSREEQTIATTTVLTREGPTSAFDSTEEETISPTGLANERTTAPNIMMDVVTQQAATLSPSKIPVLTKYYIIGAAVGAAFLLIAIILIVRRSRRSRGNEAKDEDVELHPDSQKSE